jgi:parallel beta-helix repeat protein
MLFVVTIVLITGNATAASHEPVVIDGNDQLAVFVAGHGNVGDGSSGSPFQINGLVIDADDEENGIVIKNVDDYLNIDNCVVNNTRLFNSDIGSGAGIFISSSSHIFVCNSRVNETYDGITVLNSQNVVVYGNTVHNVTMAGVKIAGCSNVKVYQNNIADSYGAIIAIQSTHGSSFDNNTCLRGVDGLLISGSYQNVISDNIVKGFTYGMYIEAGSNFNKIDLNNCSSNSNSGIFIAGDRNTVAANKVFSNGFSGIQVNEADNCTLTGNLCIDNPRGIYATGANYVTLNGNNCSRSSQYGFYANYCEHISTDRNRMYFNGQGIYLTNCRDSYLWYDTLCNNTQYGFFSSGSSWIYTTSNCTYNKASGFWIVNSDNCTIGSANASHNAQNGAILDSCYKCRVIDGSFMSNVIGIRVVGSDNSTVQRIRAYLNQEGVELYNSDNATVSDCHLTGNIYGLWISDSDRAWIVDNDILLNSHSGVLLTGPSGSVDCNISGNQIAGPGSAGIGIEVSSGLSTMIQDNTITGLDRGMKISNANVISLDQNHISECVYGIWMQLTSFLTVTENTVTDSEVDGIYAELCLHGVFDHNTLTGGVNGMCFEQCTDGVMTNNLVDASIGGIYLLGCGTFEIYNGLCTDSTGGASSIGVYLVQSSATIVQGMNLTQCNIGMVLNAEATDLITNNVFYHNRDVGVYISDCESILLHHNRFLFNHGSDGEFSPTAYQAWDDSPNDRWNTTGPDGIGNFWSDYCWPDGDRNGIVDEELLIPGGAYDYFPIADTGAPVVDITSPDHDGVIFTTDTASISWQGIDDYAGIQYFEVKIDDGVFGNIGLGNLCSFGGLTDGRHIVTVKAVDKAGNENTATRTLYIDANAPVVNIVTPENHTAINDNTPTISWTGTDAGSTVAEYMVAWDLGVYESVGTVNSFTFILPLDDGSHTVYLWAKDASNHIRVCSLDFYVDTRIPTLDSISPSDGTPISDRDIPISWYAFDLAVSPFGLDRTELRLDDGDWVNKGLGTSHTFLDVTEGPHTIYLRTYDKAGNTVEKSSRVLVDFALPTITISSPSNHTICAVNTISITWTGADSGSGIDHYEVGLDSGPMTSVGTATGWTFDNLFDGTHDLRVMAVDKSVKMRIAFLTVVIDTVAPSLSVMAPTEGGFYIIPTLNITWSSMEFGSGLAYYEVKVDTGEWQSQATRAYDPIQMSEGLHTVYVRATDLAGNARTVGVNMTVDLNPPVIHSMTPAEGSMANNATVLFGWDVSDSIGISSITYSIDSDINHGLTSGASSVSVSLTPGNHTFKLTVTDRAWRATIGYVNVTADGAAPRIVAHSPSTANAGVNEKISFRFSETVSEIGISVKVNGQECPFTMNGTNYEVSRQLVGGTNYTVIVAGAKDLSGNTMEVFSWSFNSVSGEMSPGRFVLRGTMIDKDGKPISSATVVAGGQSLTTNAQGQFSVYVDAGQLQLRVSASGMTDYVQGLVISSDQELGQLTMISLTENIGENSGSKGGDITPFLIIGALAAVGGLVTVVVIARKRRKTI